MYAAVQIEPAESQGTSQVVLAGGQLLKQFPQHKRVSA